MRCTFANISRLARTHWGVVTVPQSLCVDWGVEVKFVADDGREFRAVRGESRGSSATFRVQLPMDGHEMVSGYLVNKFHPNSAQPFKLHRWVADNVGELVPKLGARQLLVDGMNTSIVDGWAGDVLLPPRVIESSPAHQRWRLVNRVPMMGLYLEWWADVLHGDPVVPVWGKVVWSDRNSSAPSSRFDVIGIRAGELIAFDFAKMHGMPDPIMEAGGKNWMHLLNSSPIDLGDGCGLPLSGRMLCWRSGPGAGDLSDTEQSRDQEDLNNLMSGQDGPILGVCHEWDEQFLACRHLPRLSHSEEALKNFADHVYSSHRATENYNAGWFAPRPLGCNPYPGSVAAQEDFGATKGTFATVAHDPRYLRIMQYSVQAELFRGFNHYEVDGGELEIEDHPQWTTWAGSTHWHTGVSPDRLGKASHVKMAGWQGYDDQHRSQNGLAAYLALTDDPLMQDQVRHILTTDQAAYRVKFSEFGAGAARAQGRVLAALANLASVTDGGISDAFLRVAAERLEAIQSNPTLEVNGPMKVLAVGRPDTRKAILDADGKPGSWVSMWEHGLAVIGLRIACNQFGSSGKPGDVLRAACETLATFGFFEAEAGGYYTVEDILWSDGETIPGGLVPDSPHMIAKPGVGGVRNWTFTGVLVARDVLGASHPLASRMDGYIKSILGDRKMADTIERGEWWAVVDDITFPQ